MQAHRLGVDTGAGMDGLTWQDLACILFSAKWSFFVTLWKRLMAMDGRVGKCQAPSGQQEIAHCNLLCCVTRGSRV